MVYTLDEIGKEALRLGLDPKRLTLETYPNVISGDITIYVRYDTFEYSIEVSKTTHRMDFQINGRITDALLKIAEKVNKS